MLVGLVIWGSILVFMVGFVLLIAAGRAPPEARKRSARVGLGVMLLPFAAVPIGYALAPSAPAGESGPPCHERLQCWSDRVAEQLNTERLCRRAVEAQAQYQSRWKTSLLRPMFSRLKWADGLENGITKIGDAVEFQNGFSAWGPMSYACDYRPVGDEFELVEARVWEGRLPR